jgi:predicted metal-dependent HD superfamily phosphohydrolase
MKIQNTIYSSDDEDKLQSDKRYMTVQNDILSNRKVVIKIENVEITVWAHDLFNAIKNATNH